MDINLVFYNTFSGREDFEMPCGTRKWHSLLILKEGSISFVMNGREDTAGAGDAVFFPADLFMRRRVLEPISFHQMAFFAAPDHPYASALRAGRLEVPRGHILSAVETLDRLQYGTIREREQLYCGVLDNLILENYVYSGGMPVADRSTRSDGIRSAALYKRSPCGKDPCAGYRRARTPVKRRAYMEVPQRPRQNTDRDDTRHAHAVRKISDTRKSKASEGDSPAVRIFKPVLFFEHLSQILRVPAEQVREAYGRVRKNAGEPVTFFGKPAV